MNKKNKENRDFELRTEKMLEKHELGEFKKKNAKEFLKELNRW